MKDFIPLFVALVWPITILVLVVFFRKTLKAFAQVLEARITRGDKLSAFGVTLEPSDPTLGLPSVSSPSKRQPASQDVMHVLGLDTFKRILIAIGETSRGEPSSLVGTGDALAMTTIQSVLLGLSDISVTTSVIRSRYAHIGQLLKENPNIVCVGGPLGNALTHMVMSSNPISLGFQRLDVVDTSSHQIYRAEFNQTSLSGKDYGLVLSLPNLAISPGRITVVAGCHGYGTHAAASVISHLHDYPNLLEVATGYFEALIEVSFVEGVIGTPEVLLFRRLEKL